MSPARVRLCAGGRVDASAQKHNAGPCDEERQCGAACSLLPGRATHPHLCQGNVCTSGHTKVVFFIDWKSFQRQSCCDGNGAEEDATYSAGQNSHLFISVLLYILYWIIICWFALRDIFFFLIQISGSEMLPSNTMPTFMKSLFCSTGASGYVVLILNALKKGVCGFFPRISTAYGRYWWSGQGKAPLWKITLGNIVTKRSTFKMEYTCDSLMSPRGSWPRVSSEETRGVLVCGFLLQHFILYCEVKCRFVCFVCCCSIMCVSQSHMMQRAGIKVYHHRVRDCRHFEQIQTDTHRQTEHVDKCCWCNLLLPCKVIKDGENKEEEQDACPHPKIFSNTPPMSCLI